MVKVLNSEITERIISVENLLEIYKINLEEWDIEKQVVNTWEVGAKTPDGSIAVTPLFQVKVWLVRKKLAEDKDFLRASFFEDLKKLSPKVPKKKYEYRDSDPKMLEITVFDLHYGKVAWHEETGENYNLETASRRFEESIEYHLDFFKHKNIEKILLPIGNDYFNSDKAFPYNSTTSGTPQEEDTRWQNTFKKGKELLIKVINRLTEVAPVEVIVIPGNHDYERSYYLGDTLESWFHNDENVTINNSPSPRKYFLYGKNLLGFTHGNNEKISSLPVIMAQEVPHLWAKSIYREVHLGHLHHKKEIKYHSTEEYQGVILRYMSSMSGTDSWHHRKGYTGATKNSEAFLWDPNKGLAGQSNFNSQ